MTDKKEESIFEVLDKVDISGSIKLKNKFNYLPWSTAWAMVLKRYPDAVYDIVKSDDCIYHTDGKTCWVETSVTIQGITRTETLAVLDPRNQPYKLEDVTSFIACRSIKRCLVKNLALFGLGLGLWNGEELSESAKIEKVKTDSTLTEMRKSLIALCKDLAEGGVDKELLYGIISKYNNGNKNPNSIKSMEIIDVIVNEIENVTNKEEK